jgi:predicted metalloprotease with PDZ domain
LSAGDVVIAADGLRVEGAELIARLGALPPGQAVELVAFRRDELRRATVVLGAPPEDTIELRLDPEPSPAARARREAWLGA